MIKQAYKKDIIFILIMLLLGITFFFLLGEKSYVLYKDSELYIDFERAKGLSVIYAGFLQICRLLAGEKLYLLFAVFVQGALAIFASIFLTFYIKKEFILKKWEAIVIYIFSFLPHAYTLPQHVNTHAILTEGLAFSIFYFWFVYIFSAIYKKSIVETIKSIAIALILSLIRFQLVFLIAISILLLCYIIYNSKKEKNDKMKKNVYIIWIILSLVGIILVWKMNLFESFQYHVANLVFGKVIYVSDFEDAEIFEDEETKVIFQEVYKIIDEEKLNLKYARKGLWKWQDLKCSTQINEIGRAVMKEYISSDGITQMRKDIAIPLLQHNLLKYLYVFILLFPESLLCSIFIQKESIYLLCFIISFTLYIGTIICCIFKKKKNKTENSYVFMNMVLITLTCNIIITNFIFYGLQRYLVYTFGLFYIGCFLIARKLWEKKSEYKKSVDHYTGL